MDLRENLDKPPTEILAMAKSHVIDVSLKHSKQEIMDRTRACVRFIDQLIELGYPALAMITRGSLWKVASEKGLSSRGIPKQKYRFDEELVGKFRRARRSRRARFEFLRECELEGWYGRE